MYTPPSSSRGQALFGSGPAEFKGLYSPDTGEMLFALSSAPSGFLQSGRYHRYGEVGGPLPSRYPLIWPNFADKKQEMIDAFDSGGRAYTNPMVNYVNARANYGSTTGDWRMFSRVTIFEYKIFQPSSGYVDLDGAFIKYIKITSSVSGLATGILVHVSLNDEPVTFSECHGSIGQSKSAYFTSSPWPYTFDTKTFFINKECTGNLYVWFSYPYSYTSFDPSNSATGYCNFGQSGCLEIFYE